MAWGAGPRRGQGVAMGLDTSSSSQMDLLLPF